MHAQAGTIGYDTILDEEARQAAKQASRSYHFSIHPSGQVEQHVRVPDAWAVGGTSTPSTAVSPGQPHDAEAHREAARLEAAKRLEFLRLVRAWADGADVVVPGEHLRAELRALVRELVEAGAESRVEAAECRASGFTNTSNFLNGLAGGLELAAQGIEEALNR